MPNPLDGANLLYPYLQKDLLRDDYWLFQMLTSRLVTALGVWPGPETFRRLPIMLPHVVRDATARAIHNNQEEEWASPNARGFLRDDNSLIKGPLKSLSFQSSRNILNGRSLGNGWVAAHVWQLRSDGTRASRHHHTNSFLPNLVWLPKDLALLSDRPGSFVQRYLQGLSYKIYRHVEFPDPLAGIVEDTWKQLGEPDIPTEGLPEESELNFFEHDDAWVERRIKTVHRVFDSLKAIADGGEPLASLKPTRYRNGLATVSLGARKRLSLYLRTYLDGVEAVQ